MNSYISKLFTVLCFYNFYLKYNSMLKMFQVKHFNRKLFVTSHFLILNIKYTTKEPRYY